MEKHFNFLNKCNPLFIIRKLQNFLYFFVPDRRRGCRWRALPIVVSPEMKNSKKKKIKVDLKRKKFSALEVYTKEHPIEI